MDRCSLLCVVVRCSSFVVSLLWVDVLYLLVEGSVVGRCLMLVACCSLLFVGDWLLDVWLLSVLLLFGFMVL